MGWFTAFVLFAVIRFHSAEQLAGLVREFVAAERHFSGRVVGFFRRALIGVVESLGRPVKFVLLAGMSA